MSKLKQFLLKLFLPVCIILTTSFSIPAFAQGQKTLRFIAQADLKILDPISTTAYITRNHGYMVYDISYGYQSNLPDDIEFLVTKNYSDFHIFRTIHVRFQGRNVWVVKMENLKKYLTLRIEDNEIEEVEEFNKSVE